MSDGAAPTIQRLDAGRLDGPSGLQVLLRRGLARLAPGELLEVTTRHPGALHDLPALVRGAGHELCGRRELDGATVFRLRRGPLAEVARAAPPSPGRAPTESGFALPETIHEGGRPEVPFALDRDDEIWVAEAGALYEQAVAGQWSPARDLDWSGPPSVGPALDWAVHQLMSFLVENEESALLVPARFLHQIHPHFVEVQQFLAARIADEARHIEVFRARARRAAAGPIYSTRSTRASLLTLVEEKDFTTAEFLLGVLGEGTFLELLAYIERHAPDPLTAELCRRARLDEARHVHFAMAHVRHRLAVAPELKPRLARAVQARQERLAQSGPLSPFVDDALVVLAAGGLDPARLPAGLEARDQLQRDLETMRARRLVSLGFTADEAAALAASHTPNFM